MKTKISFNVSIFFVAAIAAVLVSPGVGYSFWFGTDISQQLTEPADTEALQQDIEVYAPDLEYPPMYRDNNPDGIYGVRINNTKETWGAYTLISDMSFNYNECTGLPGVGGADPATCTALLIDMEGNLINGWSGPMLGLPAKMLPNGDVMMGQDGFFEGILTQVSWNGEVINQWGPMHHDHQREGNPVGYYVPGRHAMGDSGITMWLDRQAVTVAEQQEKVDDGEWPEVITEDFGLEDDVIWQADWEGNIVWEWHASDHFWPNEARGDLGMGFDENARYAIKNTRVGGFLGFNVTDYTHANCVSWLGDNPWFDGEKGVKDYRFHPENIIVDFRTSNILIIIARYAHPDGLWAEGSIVWRVGPDYSAVMPERKIGQIIGPHHTHMIPHGLPGWGHILLFDNGGNAGYGSYFPGMKAADDGPIGTYPNTFRDYSRIIEFNPITLEVVWDYVQAKPTMDYNGDGEIKGNERKFFASHYSSCQRLKNGNTLITEGNSARTFEVTTAGEVAWEYVHEPPPAGPFGRFYFGDYRAYRIPESWVLPHINGK